jgi:hypothetical protein
VAFIIHIDALHNRETETETVPDEQCSRDSGSLTFK